MGGLFTRGDTSLLTVPQLAIVGSRRASPSGKRTAENLAAELARIGFAVTSGLATGIDTCAHRGCLAAGSGTIAVMATGIDRVYPRSNLDLFEAIASRGLLVTEYAPGTGPRREYFPQRNRIISGLALGTLIIEAGTRSGSLITARLAGEQGREVFAVPGSIYQDTTQGCHQLIRQGATLVESVNDVLDELGHFLAGSPAPVPTGGPEPRARPEPGSAADRLYCLIDYAPSTIDELIDRSGLTADRVCSILMDLELDGLVAASADGYQRLPGLSAEVNDKQTRPA